LATPVIGTARRPRCRPPNGLALHLCSTRMLFLRLGLCTSWAPDYASVCIFQPCPVDCGDIARQQNSQHSVPGARHSPPDLSCLTVHSNDLVRPTSTTHCRHSSSPEADTRLNRYRRGVDESSLSHRKGLVTGKIHLITLSLFPYVFCIG
jgi:hypothetical protein